MDNTSFESMTETLLSLAKETEADFLKAGTQVQKVSTRCKSNAVNAAAIRNSIETGEAWNAREVDALFARAYEELLADVKSFTDALPELRALRTRTHRIRRAQISLLRLMHSIKILGGLLKLHEPRSGQTQSYLLLADAVKTLAKQLTDASSGMTLSADETRKHVSSALQLVKDIGPFRAELNLSRKETGGSLLDLSDLVGNIDQSCLKIETISREIAPALTMAVMSLQFHDITRQQMEHVSQALRKLPPRLKQKGKVTDLPLEDCPPTLKTVEIQIAQLHQVLHKTDEISAAIHRQFRGIFHQTQAQTEQSGYILDQETSLMLGARNLRTGLKRLLSLLSQSELSANELMAHLDETGGHLEYVSVQLKLVEEIELEMKQLSINDLLEKSDWEGTPHSRKTKKLIQEMIQISGETLRLLTEETTAVQQDLEEVRGFRTSLTKKLKRRLRANTEVRNALTGYLENFVEASRGILDAMDGVSLETRQLEQDIVSLLEELSFEQLTREKIGRILQRLNLLRNDLLSRCGEMEQPAPDAFAALRGNYSREIEREIHDACLTQGLDSVLARIAEGWESEKAPADSASSEDDLFDDDVELF